MVWSTFFAQITWQSSEVEHNPKMNILFFDDLGAFFIFLHFGQHFLLRSLGWSSEVERNPKMNILFFDDLGDLICFLYILVNVFCSDHLADHQKLNIIQKMNILFFNDLGGLFCFSLFQSMFFAWIAWPIIRSWT